MQTAYISHAGCFVTVIGLASMHIYYQQRELLQALVSLSC